jgi:phosphohistidine phosphatase
MKQLTLLRHAKSSWDDQSLEDFNRPLNVRGWKAARRIGRELKDHGMHFDVVLASTAARVRETIDGVQEKYDFGAPIQFEQRIYEASEAILLELVRSLPETAGSALLVGHNPGLERLIVELTHDDDMGLRHRVIGKFPTAGLAAIRLPAEHWRNVEAGSGKIVDLIFPKELD